MSIFIYQIGNVPFEMKPSSLSGLEISISRGFRGDVNRLMYMPLTTLSQPYAALEPVEISISGTLLPDACDPISSKLNRLLAMAGHAFTDVIGYLPNDCCPPGQCCSKCDGRAKRCVQWLSAPAFISSVEITSSADESGVSPTQALVVDVSMTLRDYWMPLNPWLWEPYYDGAPVTGLRQLDDAYLSSLPCKPPGHGSAFSPGKLLFNKKNYRYPFDLYDVEVWSRMPDSIGRTWGDWTEYSVGHDRTRWPAPPTSNWMFKGLPTIGQIEITVSSEVGGTSMISHDSTISLNSINLDLIELGYPEIDEDDILIATDSIYAPSIFVRDNLILPIFPIWTYRYAYIGQMLGAINTVSIRRPRGVISSHLHTFRIH